MAIWFPGAPWRIRRRPVGKYNHPRGVGTINGRDRERLQRLLDTLERMRLDEYVEYVSNRRRMIWQNILYGVCRGLGFTLGFSVLGALLAVLLRGLVVDNIPLIGGFLAEVIHAIEARM